MRSCPSSADLKNYRIRLPNPDFSNNQASEPALVINAVSARAVLRESKVSVTAVPECRE